MLALACLHLLPPVDPHPMNPLQLAAVPALSLLIAHPSPAQSTWIVDQQGAGDFTAIQEAVDSPSVADGDTVMVFPGIYVENVVVQDRRLQIIAKGRPDDVVVDGGATTCVFYFHGALPGSRLVGFTIQNGMGSGGVQVREGSDLEINSCVIRDNTGLGNEAGGIHVWGSSLAVRNCLIQGNNNNVYGAGMVIGASTVFVHGSTFRNNQTTRTSEIMVWGQEPVVVESSIFDGSAWPPVSQSAGLQVATISETLCPGGTSEYWWNSTCIDSDPVFADDGTGLAPLSSIAAGQAMDSPAIDAGSPDARPVGTTRTDGIPDCGRADMGYHAPVECGYEPFCIAAWNSTGQSAEIGACGSTSIAANALTLRIDHATRGQFGLFFYGANETFTIFGEGALCVAAPFARVLPVIATDETGSASLPLDLGNDPFTVAPNIIGPFETWRFQFWYRDPLGGPSGFNLSDGLAVTFCP